VKKIVYVYSVSLGVFIVSRLTCFCLINTIAEYVITVIVKSRTPVLFCMT
jgi:hypothetical protein